MTVDQSNRIALAENLVDSAKLRVLQAESRVAHAQDGYIQELAMATHGLKAAQLRLEDAQRKAQVITEGDVA